MKNIDSNKYSEKLKELCTSVKSFAHDNEFDICLGLINDAMKLYPDAPQPYNLLGIIMEKMGNHALAMKNFRQAWKLDPTYLPVNHNLITYGTFMSTGICAFDEDDVPKHKPCNFEVTYDEYGLGHIHTKNKIKYDKYGIVHVTRR